MPRGVVTENHNSRRLAKRVQYRGQTFESIQAAADFAEVHDTTMSRALKNGFNVRGFKPIEIK